MKNIEELKKKIKKEIPQEIYEYLLKCNEWEQKEKEQFKLWVFSTSIYLKKQIAKGTHAELMKKVLKNIGYQYLLYTMLIKDSKNEKENRHEQ